MLKFKICDCCGKTIDLNDGKIHTEWSEHVAYCKEVPIANKLYPNILYPYVAEGHCLIDFVFEVQTKESSRAIVPHDCKADLCDECKLMLLENAAEVLRSRMA